MKIHPRCVYCLKVQEKWHLFRGDTLACEQTGKEVGEDSACEDFALDSARMLEWAHYRKMDRDLGKGCLFCKNHVRVRGKGGSTERLTCRLLPVPYGNRPSYVCDFCDPIDLFL